uniref:Uncharacterized protein n=1 Tax=Lotharella globosa TaxID=91324 RepID=A0A7S3YYM1_9EUKA
MAIDDKVRIFPIAVNVQPDCRFRACVIEASPTYALRQACVEVRRVIFPEDRAKERKQVEEDVHESFRPHVSLMYGEFDKETLTPIWQELYKGLMESDLKLGYKAEEVALVMTEGEEHQCWKEVARFPIERSRPKPVPRDPLWVRMKKRFLS